LINDDKMPDDDTLMEIRTWMVIEEWCRINYGKEVLQDIRT